jgi:hypothetical protein
MVTGGRERDLAANSCAGLAFADAFDLGRVQGIDLRAALTMVLEADLDRQVVKTLPACSASAALWKASTIVPRYNAAA